jgi:hypothetical protein
LSEGVKRPAIEARPVAEALLALIRPHLAWGEIAGSLRRGKAEVGDVEIVATALPSYLTFMDSLVQQGMITKALYGEKKMTRWGGKYRGLIFQNMKIEIFLCDDWNRGYLLWLRTGPGNPADNANAYLVTKIKHGAPFHVKDGYVYQGDERLKIATEQDWFALCGLPYIEPKDRSVKRYARHFGARHQWGDPSKYKERQRELFDVSRYFEPSPVLLTEKPKAARPLFVWTAPFLCSEGKIWTYVGYGEWETHEITHHRARAYWDQLNRMPDAYRVAEGKRLTTYLQLRDARLRRELLANVLLEAMAVLRDRSL